MDDLHERLAALREPMADGLRRSVLDGVGLVDHFGSTDSPIGPVTVAYNTRGVALVLAGADEEGFRAVHRARLGRDLDRVVPLPEEIATAVRTVTPVVPVDLRGLTRFQAAVLDAASSIPPGDVRTYRWVAERIGRPRAVRAVGSALGANPVPLLVPCHRVVRSDGSTGGYAFGPAAKAELLRFEARL